jgi:DNA-binding YbaB/EbfC family protein
MRVPGGGGGAMLQQLQKVQEEMVKTQEALGEETVTVTAGGGAITVVISGHQKIQSITIEPEVVDPDDVEMLQDLVLAAVNEAIDKSQKLASDRLGALTGGLSIPGLM